MRRQAQCKELQQLELAPGRYPWNWERPYRAPSVATDVGSSGTCNVPALREAPCQTYFANRSEHRLSLADSSVGDKLTIISVLPSPDKLLCSRYVNLEFRNGIYSTERIYVRRMKLVHASVRGYGDPFRVLIDSGASTNFARRQTVARNGDKYADALRESKGRGQVTVRLTDGTVVMSVKFEDFDSTESFLVLDMDKYDLILGMPWLEKHEPWIDWRGKAIGASRSAVSDRALFLVTVVLGGKQVLQSFIVDFQE
ncbi:LOW QUALITY PROTEIN: Hypothetical protein PHPALM_5790 [Phytophthora palmivora]|uniref:Gag protein n=1 Tax=Phytophthora palmivora TaxID=4796 RepID=A0A2P4YGI5_9STRA|nr:LOW QUALITY PROTEIN: Hypothetical protein PHPALM_5790 [Phytophthora palmivora]